MNLRSVVICQMSTFKSQFSRIKCTIQCWIYSWIRSSLIDESEYEISKASFFSYLKSFTVIQIIGEDGVRATHDFVRNNILPHEQNFVFYKRQDVRHFEMYTNTPHEGTMNALKYQSSAALPSHSLTESHEVQVFQDEKKHVVMEKEAISEFIHSKVWSTTQTSKYLTTVAESILLNSMSQIENYASWRKSDELFLVTRSVEITMDTLLPKFARLHQVINENGILKCSCKFHERNGIPCVHIAHVLKKHYSGLYGFQTSDVAMFSWSVKL